MSKLRPQFRPYTDIIESEDRFCVYVELPGVNESNCILFVKDRKLIVSARSHFHEFDDVMVNCLEFWNVDYYLELELSEIIKQTSSSMHEGLLEINLLKKY